MTAVPASGLVIAPIGDIPGEISRTVESEVRRVFGLATEHRVLLRDLAFAFDASRDQYHSTRILEALADEAPPRALKVLAITRVDLFIPILTFVYGEAQLGGRAAVVSTHRLREGISLGDEEAFLDRIAKEAVHELGHTFRLKHCRETGCIMHYCRSVKDVDRKSNQICRYCRVLLQDELGRLAAPASVAEEQ